MSADPDRSSQPCRHNSLAPRVATFAMDARLVARNGVALDGKERVNLTLIVWVKVQSSLPLRAIGITVQY
jgi:hypothetical protein